MNQSIILVEDNIELATIVSEFLTENGFDVEIVNNGIDAPERVLDKNPAAVILDINLPGKDGFEVCREVRSRYRGAIIILTARGDEIDEVIGLEIGADDFMSKPVRPRALLARLKTHLRRTNLNDEENEEPHVHVGELTIDSSRRTCVLGEMDIELTTAEFDLLWILAKNAGKVVSRSDLYLELNGYKYDGLDRSIDLRISRLRKKLNDDSSNPQRIKSVRGTGYMLTAGS